MANADEAELLEVDGRAVRISSPSKPYFTRGVHLGKHAIWSIAILSWPSRVRERCAGLWIVPWF